MKMMSIQQQQQPAHIQWNSMALICFLLIFNVWCDEAKKKGAKYVHLYVWNKRNEQMHATKWNYDDGNDDDDDDGMPMSMVYVACSF